MCAKLQNKCTFTEINLFYNNLMRLGITLFALLTSAYALGQGADNRATYVVDGAVEKEQYRSHVPLESLGQGASVVYALNGVKLNLTKVRLNKTSGTVNDATHRETGLNAAILVEGGSKVAMEQCQVNSHTAMADGLTAKGQDTRVDVTEGEWQSSRNGSVLMNAVDGAVIKAVSPKVFTYSNQSPVFHTGVGGTLEVTDAVGESAGQASPLFYSSGDLVAQGCRMESSKWSIGNVDGGKLTLNKNVLTTKGFAGFLVYGNKYSEREGLLELNKNQISVSEGPLFYVTNTTSEISVTNNKISLKGNDLMIVCADDWGQEGSNGGHITLSVQKQALSGMITVDSISSADIQLLKGGSIKGCMNPEENRCAKIHVFMGEGSTWSSRGDSYITSIVFNAPLKKGLKQLKGKHTIYYDPSDPANAYLEGKEYKTGGGWLRPLK